MHKKLKVNSKAILLISMSVRYIMFTYTVEFAVTRCNIALIQVAKILRTGSLPPLPVAAVTLTKKIHL